MRELAYVPSSVCPSVLEFQYSATAKYRIFTASSREKDDYNNWRGPLECLTSGAPHSELFIKPNCDFRSYQRQGQTPRALSFRFCPNLTHMVYWCDDTLAMVNLLDVNQIQITDVSASRVVGLDRQDISTEKFSFLCPVHTVISYLNLIDV